MSAFKPMLAADAAVEDIRFPALVSPKLDGIRCVMLEGKCLTRSLKPVPNKFVRSWMEEHAFSGLDGELMLPRRRNGTLPDFNEVQSAIMSRDGEPDFEFHAFDLISSAPFHQRLISATEVVTALRSWRLKAVEHRLVGSAKALEAVMRQHLDEGYEGTMVRDPNGTYKFGRSTLREGGLLKLKPFLDDEAEIIDMEPAYHNTNEQTRDNLGRAERSTHAEGLVAKNEMGALICRMKDGTEVRIGTGFTTEQRQAFWNMRPLSGVVVTFKHQRPPGGVRTGAPRSPVFKGFRDSRDL